MIFVPFCHGFRPGGTRSPPLIPLHEGEPRMAIDPVCKMKVDEQSAPGQTNYNGKDYFFCSKDCEQKFEHDPQQYTAEAA